MKPNTEFSILLLQRSYILTTAAAPQRPISKLLHVTVDLEVLLYMHQVTSLLQLQWDIKHGPF
jgi:hypothetical protein